jgi:methyl-accepting chemotaxis protein
LLYCLLSRQVGSPLNLAVKVAEGVARGNLKQKIDVGRGDETGKLLNALQTMSDNLARITRSVHERAQKVGDAARQIAMGNMDISQHTEQQAATLEETAVSIEAVSVAARGNVHSAQQVSRLAITAAVSAADNARSMARLGEVMNALHVGSKKIGDIVGIIDGLAFQTNILALNAAVEAARAGEQGRGFAVVASEVRSLAQRSSQSAKDIRALISESTASVARGTQLAKEVAQSSEQTQQNIQVVTQLMGEITSGSQDQSTSIEQVNKAMVQLDKMTQQNAALVEEASAAAQSLEEQAYRLFDAVKLLRIDDSEDTSASAVVPLASLSLNSPRRASFDVPTHFEAERFEERKRPRS